MSELVKICYDKAFENINRAYNLVAIYKDLYGGKRGRKTTPKSDVLRAAVVLMHASLEDFLRALEEVYLPEADERTLDTIPFVGQDKGRSEKISLGKLASHKGKTVDCLIRESVVKYLDRSNYNNIAEVSAALERIGVDLSSVRRYFSDIEEMMQRRHQIVHRADRVETKGRGRQSARPISADKVDKWINVVWDFISEVNYRIKSI